MIAHYEAHHKHSDSNPDILKDIDTSHHFEANNNALRPIDSQGLEERKTDTVSAM